MIYLKSERNYLKLSVAFIALLLFSTLLSILLTDLIKNNTDLFKKLFFPIEFELPELLNYLGLLISILGISLNFWANYMLIFVGKIGLKSREPFSKPSILMTSGPFKYTRNPIYISVLLLLFGLGVFFESVTAFLAILFCFAFFQFKFIKYEEDKLEKAFGSEYLDYKSLVKRWI